MNSWTIAFSYLSFQTANFIFFWGYPVAFYQIKHFYCLSYPNEMSGGAQLFHLSEATYLKNVKGLLWLACWLFTCCVSAPGRPSKNCSVIMQTTFSKLSTKFPNYTRSINYVSQIILPASVLLLFCQWEILKGNHKNREGGKYFLPLSTSCQDYIPHQSIILLRPDTFITYGGSCLLVLEGTCISSLHFHW